MAPMIQTWEQPHLLLAPIPRPLLASFPSLFHLSESLGMMLGLRSFQYLTLFDPILVAVKAWDEANGLFCLVAGYLSFSLHTFVYLLQEVSLSTPA